MAVSIARTDTSLFGRWWWTVDRWTLGAIGTLMTLGLLLSFAASPDVAQRLHLHSFYFVLRHALLLLPSFLILIGVSFFSPKTVRRFALLLLFMGLIFLILTPFLGVEIKGAKRWIPLGSQSLQASELMKPALAVFCAWMFAEKKNNPSFPGTILASGVFGVVLLFLLAQPDLGMTVLLTSVWFAQLFLAGLPLIWISVGCVTGVVGLIGAYFFFPHVTRRIDQFLYAEQGDRFADQYQITQSLEAIMNGGILGQGPGEGTLKKHLPDAHADFIFAVAGEEFGLILCLLIVALFVFIVLRSWSRIFHEDDPFVMLSVVGLSLGFGLQAMINISSTINLIPTKGMTLPFMSYGGSSMLSLAISMGMVLALTRRRPLDRRRR